MYIRDVSLDAASFVCSAYRLHQLSLRSVKMSFAPSHYCLPPHRAVYFKEPPKVARVEPTNEPEVARPENIVCPAGDTVKGQRNVTVEQLKREVEDLRTEVNSLSCKLNTVLCTKTYGFTDPIKSELIRNTHVEDAAPVSVSKSAKKKYEESFYAGFETDNYYAGSDVNPYSQKRSNDAPLKVGSASVTDTCMETY
ncbi:hypothetical protein DdX_15948 [Ditylenchus destructor]|uniref:Uncharacterized protein n=1 Tax=Ditylenchus destructor TaxID=166010 RepID=A0AAD4MUG4_9BILA|nr:hypothetical protein DdX_15948 [Ditylenchus destructor]